MQNEQTKEIVNVQQKLEKLQLDETTENKEKSDISVKESNNNENGFTPSFKRQYSDAQIKAYHDAYMKYSEAQIAGYLKKYKKF